MSTADLQAAELTKDEVDSSHAPDIADTAPFASTDFTSLSPNIDPPYTPCTYEELGTDEVTSLQTQLQETDEDPATSEVREHLQEELEHEWQNLINRAMGQLRECMTCGVCNETPGVDVHHQMPRDIQEIWHALQILDIRDVEDLHQDPGVWLKKMTPCFQAVEMAYREEAFKEGCPTLADHGHGVP